MLFFSPFPKNLNDFTLYFKQAVLSRPLNQVTKSDEVTGILEIVSGIEVDVSRKRHTAVLLAPVSDHETHRRHHRPLKLRRFFLRQIHLLNSVLHFGTVSLDIIHRNSGERLVNIIALSAVIFADDINKLRCHIFRQPPTVRNRLAVGLRNIEKVSAPVALAKDSNRPRTLIYKPTKPVPRFKLSDLCGIGS
jgi:hypothetical protein